MSNYKEQLQQNNEELAGLINIANNMSLQLQDLRITENGTYIAGEGYDAIRQVEVEVAGGPQVSIKTITYEIGPRTDFQDDEFAVAYIDPYTLTLTNRQFREGDETGAFEILETGILTWSNGASTNTGAIDPYDKDTGKLIPYYGRCLDNNSLLTYANIHLKIGKF